MLPTRLPTRRFSAILLLLIAPFAAQGQQRNIADPLAVLPQDRIAGPIDDTRTVRLPENIPPQMRTALDAGPVEGDRPLRRMILALKRSGDQQAALDALSHSQQDPKSPLFHRWLAPQEYGAHFGLSQNDLDQVTSWLKRGGFTIDDVPAGHWMIIFSGTVAQAQSAFHTSIHYFRVGNATHYANVDDPQVPAALAGVAYSISGLHDFPPKPAARAPKSNGVLSNGGHYMDPSDFATIYDLNPLYAAGINGSGVGISVIEWCTMDVSLAGTFWGIEGLSQTSNWYWDYGSPPQCSASDFTEVYLDYEWSGAVAPQAKIWLVSSGASDETTRLLDAVTGVVNNQFTPVITMSYSVCESQQQNQVWLDLWQQAHSSGIAGIVSSGDSGPAGCDDNTAKAAANGLSISGYCNSEYVVCVGGTEFADSSNPASYWSSSGEALGYIPAVAWNESAANGGADLWSSGGGYSTFTATPSWQAGNPTKFRGVPDLALSAAAHDSYRICTEPSNCFASGNLWLADGTSAAAPTFAAMIALVIQATGEPQGSVNATLYALAAQSDLGVIFHDITQGNNIVPCKSSSPNCTKGLLGYSAGLGWDPVTGLGSVDANALVTNWRYAFSAPTIPTISSLSPTSATAGGPAFTLTVNGINFTAGSVTRWNGTSLPTTFVNSTQLRASVSASLIASAGTAAVTVSSGGQTSNSVSFPINAAAVTLVTYLTSTANGVVSGGCVTPPSVSSFTTSSQQVWAYFSVTGATPGAAAIINFIRPDGVVYETYNPSVSYKNECFAYFIGISGQPAASYPGTWTVQVFWDGSTTPLFTLNFTLTTSAPTSTGSSFVPLTPCRVVDTRNAVGALGGPSITGGTSRDFAIPKGPCGIPGTATAYSLNVTAVPRGPLGYLTIWPTGQSQPLASTLNSDGRIKANAAIVPAGSNGAVSVYATNTTDVVLDINGYFVPEGSSGALVLYPLTPCRIADTRNSAGVLGGPSLAAASSRTFPILSSPCDVPSAAQAYSLNFTAVPYGSLGYLTAWPSGQTQPYVSSLNDPTGTITANAVILPAGTSGSANVFTTDETNLVIDSNGYFAPPGPGGLSLYTMQPCRVLDTRQSPGTPISLLTVNVLASSCGVPANAKAYVFNATVVPVGPLGFLTLWPDGQPQPLASTLNAPDGAITSNMAIVPTSNGSIDAFASQATHLILDISGYFAP